MLKKWNLAIPELTGSEKRRVFIYIPDSYKTSPVLRYPVLYMFDGHNVFRDEDASFGQSWGLLDYMELTQTQMIVVGVESSRRPDNSRLVEYCPFTCADADSGSRIRGQGRATMDWLVRTLKPQIDRRFPTLSDRAHTFVAGSSMGGLMSLYAIMRYNWVFSRAAALSPSLWFAPEQVEHMLRTARLRPDTMLYMDYGTKEFSNHPNMFQYFMAATQQLMERGVDLTARIVPDGEHSEACWKKQLPFFMNLLQYDLH